MKVTTKLPITVVESINIDQVIGLICVDGGNDNGRSKRRATREDGGKEMSTLPWMCLCTRTSAFVLSIGYSSPEDESDAPISLDGTILHVIEPFEKQLLMSPRGSSILRIRAASSTNSMFAKCGSVAMLMRVGRGGYRGICLGVVPWITRIVCWEGK